MSIKGGSIYYTVGVDRKSLADAVRQVEALGKAAARANGVYLKSNSVLSQYEDEVKKLSTSIKTLNNDFARGAKDPEKYRQEMAVLEQDALALRGAIENLGSTVVATSQDEARAAAMTQKLSSSLKETSAVVVGSKGAYDSLGMEVKETSLQLVGLNADVRRATQQFEAGALSAKEYADRLEFLKLKFDAVGAELTQMGQGMQLNIAQSKQMAQAQGQVTRGLTAIQKGTTRATGAMTQLELKSMLSYGGLTLLNDRIFQMSPALGILTNQLMFSVKGFEAFLRAALPIVAVAGTILALLGTLAVSLRAGSGLEVALANVRKTTNMTSEELDDLTGRFQDLSKEVPVSTMELLEIAKVAGQLGIRGVDNIARFSETVAKLAIATDVVGEEGATSLARFLQATGTAMDEMGTEAERAANVLNELENNTAATAAEILAMTSYTQGLTAQSGFTKDEILGLNAAILALGVKAEAGGSAVVRTMGKIQVAGSDGGAALERFADAAGVSVEEFQDMARNSPVDALMALTEGLNATAKEGGNLNDVLSDLGIREVRERRTLLALAQGYDTLESAMRTASDQSRLMNSLQAEVAIQSDTLVSKLKMLGARFVTIGQNIGKVLVPVAKALVDILIVLTDNFDVLAIAVLSATAALGVMNFSSIAAVATTAVARLSVAARGLSNIFLTLRLALASGGAMNLLAVLGVSLPVAVTALAALVGGGLYLAFKNFNSAARDMATSVDEAAESTSRMTEVGLVTADMLDDLIEATDESGFNGALDRLISTLNTSGQGAMRAFASSTLAPLLAQGKLKEAAEAVTLEFLKMQREALHAEFRSNQAIYNVIRNQLEGARLVLEAEEEILRQAGEWEAAGGFRALITNLERYEERAEGAADRVNELTGLLYNQETAVDASFQAWGLLEAAIYDIETGGKTAEEAVADLILALEGLAGVSPVGTGILGPDDGEDDGAEALRKAQEELRRVTELATSARDALNAVWEAASGRRFGGENGEIFTVSAIARSARSFGEAIELIRRSGIEVDNALLRLVSTIRGEGIPGMYAIRDSTEEFSEKLYGVKDAAYVAEAALQAYREEMEEYVNSLGGIGRAQVGGFSAERAETGQATAPNWMQAAAEDRIAELERVGAARATYYAEMQRIERQYAAGRMTWEEMVAAQIAAKTTLTNVLVESTLDYSDSIAVLVRDMALLENGLKKVAEAQDNLNTVQEKYQENNEKTKATGDKNLDDQQDQIALTKELEEAYAAYAAAIEEVDALVGYGLLDSTDKLSAEISAQERLMYALAEATGWYSKAVEQAAIELERLRAAQEKGTGDYGAKGGTPTAKPTKGANEFTTSYGIDFGPAETMLGTFVQALGAAAEESAILGSVFASWATVTDQNGKVISSGLDPMMLFFQILGKVLERSEAFAEVMALLDTILDPVVTVFDAMLRAIMPTVQVLVALVETALKPFVWIVTNVLAPVLLGVANIIKGIWNALAAVIPFMNPIEDGNSGGGGEDGARPGSIAHAEAKAQLYRERWREAASEADRAMWLEWAEFWEDRARALSGEDPIDRDAEESMTAGTQISAITGPTRDLLMDLLRPLSILPSWTSMIQDIRNDVRSIATMGGFTPASFETGTMAPMAAASVTNNTISIQSLTVTTQATNAKQLFNEISSFAYKDRRGGR